MMSYSSILVVVITQNFRWIVHEHCSQFTVRTIAYQRPGNDNENK